MVNIAVLHRLTTPLSHFFPKAGKKSISEKVEIYNCPGGENSFRASLLPSKRSFFPPEDRSRTSSQPSGEKSVTQVLARVNRI
ncbi:MAG: hypothetical protein ACE5HR_08785, partial [bacterium]